MTHMPLDIAIMIGFYTVSMMLRELNWRILDIPRGLFAMLTIAVTFICTMDALRNVALGG